MRLDCRADTPSFDLCAVLSEVKPNGTVFNFSQGYCRVNSASAQARLTLQPTCICVPRGSAVRLSLSAACFPAYAMNPGTAVLSNQSELIEAQVITVKVRSGEGCTSEVLLPIG